MQMKIPDYRPNMGLYLKDDTCRLSEVLTEAQSNCVVEQWQETDPESVTMHSDCSVAGEKNRPVKRSAV